MNVLNLPRSRPTPRPRQTSLSRLPLPQRMLEAAGPPARYAGRQYHAVSSHRIWRRITRKRDPEGRTVTVEQLLTVKQAAQLLSCSEAAIRKWVYQRRLPIVKVGRLTRLRARDLEALIAKGLTGVPAAGR